MFEGLKQWLGFSQPAAPLAYQPPANDVLAAANENGNQEAAPIDWVESANQSFAGILRHMQIKRLLPSNQTTDVKMPVIKLEIGPAKKDAGVIRFGGSAEEVQITVQINDKVGNFQRDSIDDAFSYRIESRAQPARPLEGRQA